MPAGRPSLIGELKGGEEMQTKSAARNIFYGGSLFFFVILVGLVAQSHGYIRNVSTNEKTLSASVLAGKRVWEENACINCHTLLGEGAYFAPELGNACKRLGGKEAIAGFIESQPSGAEGRRQMPNFHLSKKQLSDVADFLCWVSTIKTQNWPPKEAG
jgi:nitric oxide reductase subunit C